jgi:hypothetical protein
VSAAGLPVQQIAATELVINRRVAKSRGLPVLAELLACADEAIDQAGRIGLLHRNVVEWRLKRAPYRTFGQS